MIIFRQICAVIPKTLELQKTLKLTIGGGMTIFTLMWKKANILETQT